MGKPRADIADYIKRTVDAAPPLSPEQRATIRTLVDLPPPDEQTARRVLAKLRPVKDANSEPLDVRLHDE